MDYYIITGYCYETRDMYNYRRIYRRMEVRTGLQVIKAQEDINDQIRKTGDKRCRYIVNVSTHTKEEITGEISHEWKGLKDMTKAEVFYNHNGRIDINEYLVYTWDEYLEDIPEYIREVIPEFKN